MIVDPTLDPDRLDGPWLLAVQRRDGQLEHGGVRLRDRATDPVADRLEAKLRERVDPEALDARSKADQAAHMERFGGVEAVRREGVFSRSPIPGKAVEMEMTGGA